MYGLGKVKTKKQLYGAASAIGVYLVIIGVVVILSVKVAVGEFDVDIPVNKIPILMICLGPFILLNAAPMFIYYWLMERNIRNERQ